jgi:large repetitive protein
VSRPGLRLTLSLLATVSALALAPSAVGSSYTIVPGGAPVTATTTAANENARLTFAGTSNQRVSLRMTGVTIGTSTCCSTKVSILKPDGTMLVGATNVGTSGGFIDARTLPVTGTYTILVDPQGTATGSMTLALHDVPPDATATATPGGPEFTLTTTVPGQNARATFAGAAGDRVSLEIGPACCSTKASVLRPNGTALIGVRTFGTAGGFIDTFTLPVTGTFTIVVDPQGAATGSVALTLYDVPGDATASIVAGGGPATVTTTVPGQNARVTFSGAADQRISLAVGPTCCSLRVSIVDPFGTTVVAPTSIAAAGGFIDTKTLAANGPHTIVVDPQGAPTGAVTLTLYDVPPDATAAITPDGAATTVTTTVPGQNARLTFAGTAGQQVTVRVTGSTYSCVRVTLLKPDNTSMTNVFSCGSSFNLSTQTLPTTGTYAVTVDPNSASIGSISVRVTSP